ncbi:hypothetical protein ACFRMQ_09570 [Kitasatospora sp. NPDC056783]|uniref:hypothetical protein n=1 Tax=Kitasatospora sp. NPDC056783 TaxID=3345943 RepID=UPI0036A9E55D
MKFRRFKPNKAGIRSIMKLPTVGKEVGRITNRVAGAASANGGDFRTDLEEGRTRWRGAVIGNYSFPTSGGREGSRRDLLRGLDGAHGE